MNTFVHRDLDLEERFFETKTILASTKRLLESEAISERFNSSNTDLWCQVRSLSLVQRYSFFPVVIISLCVVIQNLPFLVCLNQSLHFFTTHVLCFLLLFFLGFFFFFFWGGGCCCFFVCFFCFVFLFVLSLSSSDYWTICNHAVQSLIR